MEKKFYNYNTYSHIFSQDISLYPICTIFSQMTPSWLSKNIYLSILLQN